MLLAPTSQDDELEWCLDELLTTISEPIFIQSREMRVTPSIGLARFPDDGRNIQDLMRHADLAMYHAKDHGRNNYTFFDKFMSEAVESRISLESELQTALEQEQLVTFFQPRVDVATNEIIGAEALVRWLHPTKGLVPPCAFIPACEASGLVKQLGKIVLAQSVMAQ